jgi:hypothetical protein
VKRLERPRSGSGAKRPNREIYELLQWVMILTHPAPQNGHYRRAPTNRLPVTEMPPPRKGLSGRATAQHSRDTEVFVQFGPVGRFRPRVARAIFAKRSCGRATPASASNGIFVPLAPPPKSCAAAPALFRDRDDTREQAPAPTEFGFSEFNLTNSDFWIMDTPSRSFQRGGSRSSRTRDGMRWTRTVPLTKGSMLRTAKSCGPDTLTPVSSWRDTPLTTVAKERGSPGRARRKP